MPTLSQFCGRLSNEEYGKYWHYEKMMQHFINFSKIIKNKLKAL